MLMNVIPKILACLWLSLLVGATKLTDDATTVPANPPVAIGNVQIQPEFISLQAFEALLRRTGELFRPGNSQSDENTPVPVPHEQMRPPTLQQYDFYMPAFDTLENKKLDEKSRDLEKIAPPPMPRKQQDEPNFYSVKPKKLPKKFDVAAKHINVHWLNAYEREALPVVQTLENAGYLANDERNRINFDDAFFAIDTHVKEPGNQLQKEQRRPIATTNPKASPEEFLNQEEDISGEDLVAVPAAQVSNVYNYRQLRRV